MSFNPVNAARLTTLKNFILGSPAAIGSGWWKFTTEYPMVSLPVTGALGIGTATRILPEYPQEKIGDVASAISSWLASVGIDGIIAFGNRVVIPSMQAAMDKSVDFANTIASDPAKISKPIYGEGAPKNMIGLDELVYNILAAHPIMTGAGTLLATGTISYIAYNKYKDHPTVKDTANKITTFISNILD